MKARQIVIATTLALLANALEDQLKRPAEERTWRGRLGPVPYDLRPPTISRIRAAIWDPENPSIVAPKGWGIGWTLNLYRLRHLRLPPFKSS